MVVCNKKILASILLIFMSSVCMVAQESPPEPQTTASSGGPGLPGFPIDDGLIILFVVAIIYGVYISLKFSKKSKQI